MSFFCDTPTPPEMEMSFYTPRRLLVQVNRALSGCEMRSRVRGIPFADRSIFTSRHTSTGLYNPRIPRIRDVVNGLLSGRLPPDRIGELELPLDGSVGIDPIGMADLQAATCSDARWTSGIGWCALAVTVQSIN